MLTLSHTASIPTYMLRSAVERITEAKAYDHLLYKPHSYFSRFFSNESWREWLENRTPLGRVIACYESGSLEGLDDETISRAARAVSFLSPFPKSIDLDSLNETEGMILEGVSDYESLGSTIDTLKIPEALLIGSIVEPRES